MSNGTDQIFEVLPVSALLERVGLMHKEGYRLVQIGATRLPEHIELTYSFDRDRQLANLRLQIPAAGARVPSVSGIYWCAFLYENELHDLFNLQVDGMAVDFHGHFYQTMVAFPFGSTKAPVAPAPAAPAAAMATATPAEKPATASHPTPPAKS